MQMIHTTQQDAVIGRALDAGIGMINAGADEQSSRDAVALSHKYPQGVWATVGHHPSEALIHADIAQINAEIKKLAQDEKVVGIGECGLEYFKLDSAHEEEIKKSQKELFEAHIQLAHEVQKPLVIHCREAFADTIEILKMHRGLLLSYAGLPAKALASAGILHFFTGTISDACELLKLGFSFTFGGLITFNRSFDEIIKFIPVDKILAETDAPWVAPLSHRGQQNEPLYIPEVVEWLAKIKGVEQKEMEKILLENTKRVFGLEV